jgi:hypothetical protein
LLSALREWEIFGRAIPHELSGPLGIAEGFAEALREQLAPRPTRERPSRRGVVAP